MSRTATVLVTLLVLALVLGYAVWHLMGESVSADLSVIGEGSPVAVLVYENYAPDSMEHLEHINAVRDDFHNELEFRVATMGSPAGDAFIDRYDAPRGALVVLDGNGELLAGLSMPDEPEALARRLRRLRRRLLSRYSLPWPEVRLFPQSTSVVFCVSCPCLKQ